MQNESSLGPAGNFSDAPTGGQPGTSGGTTNGTREGASEGGSSGAPYGEPQGKPRAPQPRRATARFMLSHPLHILSLGFGSGLSPIAPGTVGTLFAWASFAAFSAQLTVIEWGILIVVGFVGGIGICSFTANRLGIDDPSPVVWDEIVAFWLVLLMVTPATFTGQLWAFIIFRFFDMVKPPPIRYFDRRLKGGFGIMFDDLVAAFFTLLVIALWRMSV